MSEQTLAELVVIVLLTVYLTGLYAVYAVLVMTFPIDSEK